LKEGIEKSEQRKGKVTKTIKKRRNDKQLTEPEKAEKELRGANKGKEKSLKPSKKEEMTSNLRNQKKGEKENE
jgi:hypothetical protein